MQKLAICTLTLGLVVGASCSLVLAQDKVHPDKAEELKKSDPVPPATGKTLPEQAGTQEPSTKGAGPKASSAVFANGSLTVPGAPTDTQTTPSQYSARNAAEDRLPIVAFRLKQLTGPDRQEIYQQLTGQGTSLALNPGGKEHYALVGSELPANIMLNDLTAVPETVAAKFSTLRGTAFLRARSDVLIVDAPNSLVIGVLSAP
jgi:hypothetical protein